MTSIEHMEKRIVTFEGKEITYYLERKDVKNLNLRIRREGVVYVSAASLVPVSEIDYFICKKGHFILLLMSIHCYKNLMTPVSRLLFSKNNTRL